MTSITLRLQMNSLHGTQTVEHPICISGYSISITSFFSEVLSVSLLCDVFSTRDEKFGYTTLDVQDLHLNAHFDQQLWWQLDVAVFQSDLLPCEWQFENVNVSMLSEPVFFYKHRNS